MKLKNLLGASVAASALFAVAAPNVLAGTVSNGNDTASVTLSGHLNKAVVYYDSGSAGRMTVVDHNGSQSRARIVGTAKMNEAWTISMFTEWAMTTGNEASMSPADSSVVAGSTGTSGTDSFFAVRYNYVSFANDQLGTFAIGHNSEATDGVIDLTLSGADEVHYGAGPLFGSGVHLQADGAASNVFTGLTQGQFFFNANGGRTSLIRYDSPSFAGFKVSTTYTAEQSADVLLSFGGKFGGFEVVADAGYKNSSADTTTDETMGAALAVLHDSGLSADFNYGTAELQGATNQDPASWTAGVGYKATLTPMGSTNFRFAYGQSEDATVAGDEGEFFALGVQQETSFGAAFYLGYQRFEASRIGTDYEAVSTVFAGTKVAF